MVVQLHLKLALNYQYEVYPVSSNINDWKQMLSPKIARGEGGYLVDVDGLRFIDELK